jgi:N-acetylmuramoyl-L-alanine amidase
MFTTLLRRLSLFLLIAFLAGCASRGPYELNDSLKANGQNSRVEMIVLHYTASSKPTALMVLTNRDVSAHYVVTDDSSPVVYRIVDENRNAWHAGESSWYGRTYLNNRSIGIEIVHPGWERNNSGNMGAPFPPAQMNAVIALTKEIAKRHDIKPENIIGHSDIAPLRKQDPGPSFPWKQLAQSGLGRWFDEAAATKYEADFNKKGLPDAKWWQGQLKRVGYAVPDTGVMDTNTRHVIAAFQMHYRPDMVNGKPDAQTAGRLLALPTTGTSLR